ncbi:MAG TPA: mechanosensitive ion channel family protein [Ureibacillus sp.]|uniref:mechanosensitive ion channel family protein n=1 Tax=Peribacillus asahii TaxID=228899 RepID=UPI002079CDAB|nr:mechanosensitive ion channel family protein [Peribacillus asahii]USK60753.1 mechanosensitive ion channel family protein [Peribacillus asahii]HWL23717.1 mechanosensitive ion channel family protein [Ureibacillus sp.]
MNFLTFSENILEYINEFLLVRIIILAFIFLVISYIINKTVDLFFRKFHFWDEEVEKTIQGVIRSSLKYMSIALLVLYLIGQFIDIKAILAGAGILGVVIGFAAQQLLKDILLGTVRLTDNEFRVGNFVTFNGTSSGTIEEIGIRFMQIREWSGKLLTIPHGEIRTIQNFNKGRMRVIERITVGYQEDPRRIKELLEAVCKVCNEKYSESLLLLEDGTPEEAFQYVGITDLNPNFKYVGYEFCVVGLVKPEEYFETSRKVRFEMMSLFYDHGVQMPASNLLFQGETGNVQASDS